MEQRKKILITLPSIRYGGQEKVAVTTAKLLSQHYDVAILVFYRSGKEINPGEIPVVSCGEENAKGFKIFRRIRIMRRLKKQQRYYASISFSPSANLINVITRDKARTLTSIRGYRSLSSQSGKLKFLMRRADNVICVSEGIAAKAREYYKMPKEQVSVLYNPYNFESIKQLGKDPVDDYDFQGFTICNVSHLNEVKGLEHLLRAVMLIRRDIPNIRLLLVGDGAMKNPLMKLAETLGLNDCVTFMGYRENPYKYVAKSDLYVLTSENEGFPNSLVEAMFFVPVISANCKTGPSEILAEESDTLPDNSYQVCKYGVLTPPVQKTRNYITGAVEPEEEEIARAVVALLKDKNLYTQLKEAAHKRAHQFGEDIYLDSLMSLIEAEK